MFFKTLALLSGNLTYTLSAILIAIAACFILKVLLVYSFNVYRLYSASKKYPGPRGLPLLGNTFELVGDSRDLPTVFLDLSESYPSPFRIWIGPKLQIILHDPHTVKELLQGQRLIEKSQVYVFFERLLGNGLLTAAVDEWRVHRKLINSVFNGRVLPPYCEFFAENAQEMVKQLEVEVNGKGFEITHYIALCALKMIFGIILGPSVKFGNDELRSFYSCANRFTEIIFLRIPRAWLYPNFIFDRTALGKENNKIVKNVYSLVKQAMKKAEALKKNTTGNDASSKALPGLFMNLPRGKDGLSNQEFFYELNTVLGAGSHTLTALLDAVTRMLAYHPDIQDKVYDELYGIYGSQDTTDRPVLRDDLPRLEYLECVIHECMRLFPPIGFIERAINKDTDLGTCVLPAGCMVIINILSLHRNGKCWSNPLKFEPDRFLPENMAKRVPGAYIPFGSGPRNCIGGTYVMMAAKIISATLLRQYILRADTKVPVEDIVLKGNIVLESAEPWHVRIEKRNPRKVEAK